MLDTTVRVKERRVKPGRAPSLVYGFSGTPDQQGWFAVVDLTDGSTLHVSRMDDEGDWRVDAAFSRNGFPRFVNGYGSSMSALAVPTLALALDRAVGL